MGKKHAFSRLPTAAVCIVALLGLFGIGTASAKEPSGRIIDSPYEAVEAASVRLVTDASGRVVQIVAKACPQCPAPSILPSGDLVVEIGHKPATKEEIERFSGFPGVIHISHTNNMAYRVSFLGVTLDEEGVK
ncbi:hypothetical protein [Marinobacter sp. C2H3]|uniref:hypothetical protein n=1 Tax=Marinobacter sp. C2H3 TaxID=3119003 RepID=UPI00300E75FA